MLLNSAAHATKYEQNLAFTWTVKWMNECMKRKSVQVLLRASDTVALHFMVLARWFYLNFCTTITWKFNQCSINLLSNIINCVWIVDRLGKKWMQSYFPITDVSISIHLFRCSWIVFFFSFSLNIPSLVQIRIWLMSNFCGSGWNIPELMTLC